MKKQYYSIFLALLLMFIMGLTTGGPEPYNTFSNIVGTILCLIYFIGSPVYFLLKSKGAPHVKGLIIDEENAWFPGMRELHIQFEHEGNEYLIKHLSNEEKAQQLGQSVNIVIDTKKVEKSYVESENGDLISIITGICISAFFIYRLFGGPWGISMTYP